VDGIVATETGQVRSSDTDNGDGDDDDGGGSGGSDDEDEEEGDSSNGDASAENAKGNVVGARNGVGAAILFSRVTGSSIPRGRAYIR
jgi:hypothetical protein